MKLFGKLLLAALVIALMLPFTFLKDDNGNTLISFTDFKLPDLSIPDFPDFPDTGSVNPSAGDNVVFYKWYDSDGYLQFTTEPPPEGTEYTSKGYDPNTNVIQAVKPAKEKLEAEAKISKKKSNDASETPNPYSKESIEKLFEDAENIEKLLNQRMQSQNSAINQ
jgi:hypothetical protein